MSSVIKELILYMTLDEKIEQISQKYDIPKRYLVDRYEEIYYYARWRNKYEKEEKTRKIAIRMLQEYAKDYRKNVN